MASHNTARCRQPAVGFRKGTHVKLVAAFDEETFAQIRARAVAQGTSVAEQVRQLVEFGLIDVAAIREGRR